MGMFGSSTHDRLREFIKYVFKEKVFMGSGSSPPKEEIPFMDEWIATPDKVEDPLDKYVTRISEAPQTNRSKADDSSALTQVKLLNMVFRMIKPFGVSTRPTAMCRVEDLISSKLSPSFRQNI